VLGRTVTCSKSLGKCDNKCPLSDPKGCVKALVLLQGKYAIKTKHVSTVLYVVTELINQVVHLYALYQLIPHLDQVYFQQRQNVKTVLVFVAMQCLTGLIRQRNSIVEFIQLVVVHVSHALITLTPVVLGPSGVI